MPARTRLLDLMGSAEHYRVPAADLRAMQLAAAQELLEVRAAQIPVLRRRAEDAGVTRIRSEADLVPLLFPHTTYKSYPQSFVDNGRWDRMGGWLDTLSVNDVASMPTDGVSGVDDWVDRLWASGHEVMATSGTSGKCSFLNRDVADRHLQKRYLGELSEAFLGMRPSADRPVFQLFPSSGPNNGVLAARLNAEHWGRPGDVHFLGEEPLRVSEISRAATMRARMQKGEAQPDEIAAFERDMAGKSEKVQRQLDAMIEQIVARRHEPMFLSGQWSQHWAIVQRAREMGVPDGDFHAETIVAAGGGTKGLDLPEDYEEQVNRFYGPVVRPKNYGMTEMLLMMPRCEAHRYHAPAGVIPLVLDAEGEALAQGDTTVEGRFACLDLGLEGRWGGVISGDRVTMDLAETCACGRRGPTLLEPITRFTTPGQDDHIGCAGTIDAYIRGMLAG